MSKLSRFDEKETPKNGIKKVKNFMDGISYVPSALQELKLIANSSIFGEPNYYQRSSISNRSYLSKIDIFYNDLKAESTEDMFEKAIDRALSADFKATLEYAVELRNEMNMRLNPAVILVRAMLHEGRVKFNEENPGIFASVMQNVFQRPDDVTNQFEYYMYLKKSKAGLPSIAKRAWGKYLSSLTAYQIAKYKTEAKLIDMVRISHAKSPLIDELMKTGGVKTADEEKTWEVFRSQGLTWKEILEKTYVPHMALLRNLRGIFTEITDKASVKSILTQLQDGVKKGKQFPFRYYSAYKEIEKAALENKSIILDGLNECIEIAIAESPKMQGKTISLCDNSGSAWGAMNTSHKDGKVMSGTEIAVIGNLSGIMTAKNSEDGYVGVFGDRLKIMPITKKDSVFKQLTQASKDGRAQGGGTENGLWLFFRDAIAKNEHWDNVFIYSDQQAGHGGLYGTNPGEYRDFAEEGNSRHISLLKLVAEYRKKVNPKVNIISVQVAGYNNNVIPENFYRGAILSGWTGKEVDFAYKMAKVWDEVEGVENAPAQEVSTVKLKKVPKAKKQKD